MPLLKAVSKLSRPTPRSQNERFRSRHGIQFNQQLKGKIMFKDLISFKNILQLICELVLGILVLREYLIWCNIINHIHQRLSMCTNKKRHRYCIECLYLFKLKWVSPIFLYCQSYNVIVVSK